MGGREAVRMGAEHGGIKPSPRTASVCGTDAELRDLVASFVTISRRGLSRMLVAEDAFAHSMRREAGALARVGTSQRYGAIVLLGLAHTRGVGDAGVLDGATASEFLGRVWRRLPHPTNLGDVALLAWAAVEHGHGLAPEILERLDELWNAAANPFTVDTAWTLAAQCAAREHPGAPERARVLADALASSLAPAQALFPHWVRPERAPWPRRHLACFADQVYPIQALSMFHRAFEDRRALELARRAARRICELQGPLGQWWWHYDARNGRLIEGYPVYSVHQDSMAPMALLDHLEAGGDDHREAIRRGIRWFRHNELGAELLDHEELVIWRKIARADGKKLVRAARTLGTRLLPRLRLESLDRVFPPRVVDAECRPYHLGWILRAWQA